MYDTQSDITIEDTFNINKVFISLLLIEESTCFIYFISISTHQIYPSLTIINKWLKNTTTNKDVLLNGIILLG
jgi:hypothetical protein